MADTMSFELIKELLECTTALRNQAQAIANFVLQDEHAYLMEAVHLLPALHALTERITTIVEEAVGQTRS